MPSCVMRKCKNYNAKIKKQQGISYHMFPSNNEKKHEWITIVRVERNEHDWIPARNSRICSDHFKIEDKYTSSEGRTLLKKTATPITPKIFHRSSRSSSFADLEDADLTDMNPILDSHRTTDLKLQIRQINFLKKQMIYKYKLLKQKNKGLQKKVANMTRILKNTKENNLMSVDQFTELKTTEGGKVGVIKVVPSKISPIT